METQLKGSWSDSKLLLKGLIIGLLVLLLLVPAYYVRTLIEERESRQKEAITEVSNKWAGRQAITGPILVLPYWTNEVDSSKKLQRSVQYAYFLPELLDITADVQPREKHRGIYKVILYEARARISGKFSAPDLQKLKIDPASVIWNEALIKLPLSDNKGLTEEISLKLNQDTLLFSPQAAEDDVLKNALQADLKWSGPSDLKEYTFSSGFNLNGSEQVSFIPTGHSTTVSLQSPWPHPSFTGDILPQTSDVEQSGFKARWKTASYKRNFPQQWKGKAFSISAVPQATRNSEGVYDVETIPTAVNNNISQNSFGADLFVPVNGYQKTMRSVKYASLVILLTFVSFFLIETNNKKHVHTFHYGLIGVALILFYTLLLSFSEYIGFNSAYAIAAFFTIGLIGWFVKGLLSSSRLSFFLSFVLILLYTYVFTILQLQDYSLLLGSIGLFITLAVVMYYSRKAQL